MTGATEATFAPLALLVVLAVAWYSLNRVLFADLLSPFSLLFLSWIMPLLLQTMNLSIYETPWGWRATVMVVWVTVALTGCCLLAAPLARPGPPDAQARAYFRQMVETLRSPTFRFIVCSVYAVSFCTYLYAEFLTNPIGVPLIAALQGRFTSGEFHRWGKDSQLAVISALLLILTPMAYALYRAARGGLQRLLLLLMTVLFPIMATLKLSRSDLFVSAIGVGAVALIFRRFSGQQTRHRRQIVKVLSLALPTVVVFYLIMGIRIANVGNVYSRLTGFRLSGDGPLHGFAAVIYGYTALPFDNLNRFLSAYDGSYNLGISVFRPFLSASGLGDLADRLNATIHHPPYVSLAAGNDTFLTAVYAELGVIGIVAVPIAYATLVNLLYIRMRARPTLGNVFVYINFLYPWLWLFFLNAFGALNIYVNGMFVAGLALLATELWHAETRSVTARIT